MHEESFRYVVRWEKNYHQAPPNINKNSILLLDTIKQKIIFILTNNSINKITTGMKHFLNTRCNSTLLFYQDILPG